MMIYAKSIDYTMARNHKNSHKNFYLRFESSVIHKGTKTSNHILSFKVPFESSVIHKNVKLKVTKEYFCILSIDFIFGVLT